MTDTLSMDDAISALVSGDANINKDEGKKTVEATVEANEDSQADPAIEDGELGDDDVDALDDDPASEDDGGNDEEDDALETASVKTPEFWDKEGKEKFKALPKEMQELVLDYDTKARVAVTNRISEAAEAKKAADHEAKALLNVRSSIEQSIETANLNFANKWEHVDWERSFLENPQGTHEALQQFKSEQESMRKLQAAKQEATNAALATYYKEEGEKLKQIAEKDSTIKQLVDPVHGVKNVEALANWLKTEQGIADESLNLMGAQEMSIAYKAYRWDQSQKKAASASTNTGTPKSAQTQTKMRATSAPSQPSNSSRSNKVENRFRQTASIDDAIQVMLARNSNKGK